MRNPFWNWSTLADDSWTLIAFHHWNASNVWPSFEHLTVWLILNPESSTSEYHKLMRLSQTFTSKRHSTVIKDPFYLMSRINICIIPTKKSDFQTSSVCDPPATADCPIIVSYLSSLC